MDRQSVYQEMKKVLTEKVIPFWLENGIDREYGGYLTDFDRNGKLRGSGEKYIVTQSRMLWGFSHLSTFVDTATAAAMKVAADQGYDFIIHHFLDTQRGGFFWKTDRSGEVLDGSKLVYGQSFAIYALSEYARCFRNSQALDYARRTFDLLQVYAADTVRGGYFENLERDWTISEPGFTAGDRKSLDIHMHLMEAFTTLYEAGGDEICRRKLKESIYIILRHMVNTELGFGYNQFDLDFNRIPAINIAKTWNAERETNESIDVPTDTTSYGHNVELAWLLDHALDVLGEERENYNGIQEKLLDHALRHGYDNTYGGVYRDGVGDGDAVVLDKEWWQNFESMTGFLNGYRRTGNEVYWDAFAGTWSFVKEKFLNMEVGESRQLLDREGNPIVADIGNPWKGVYHTGRAVAECLKHLELLGETGENV